MSLDKQHDTYFDPQLSVFLELLAQATELSITKQFVPSHSASCFTVRISFKRKIYYSK
jgi:hypothetical protein